MGPSYAAVNPANFELSPSRVTWNGIDLGGTNNNVVVKPTIEKAEMKADQFGSSVLNRKIKGVKIQIETILAETKNKDRWMAAFPSLRDVTVGPDRVLDFVSKIGQDDLSQAKPLLLHPLSLADADKSGDFFGWLAMPEEVSEITFGPEAQQGLKVVWNLYLDTSVTPARIARLGDKDIVVTSGVGSAAIGFATGTNPMEFRSTIIGSSRNGNTLNIQIDAAAPNPSNTVIAAFSGTQSATVVTITPNDGTNNGGTPVSINEYQFAELINTGKVEELGPPISIALSDPNKLRTRQTARLIGSNGTLLANGGPLDGDTVTFAGGTD